MEFREYYESKLRIIGELIQKGELAKDTDPRFVTDYIFSIYFAVYGLRFNLDGSDTRQGAVFGSMMEKFERQFAMK